MSSTDDAILNGGIPMFAGHAEALNSRLAEFDVQGLQSLMSVSTAIAEKTAAGIAAFGTDAAPRRPAVFSYSGTVFSSLDPGTLAGNDLEWGNEHLVENGETTLDIVERGTNYTTVLQLINEKGVRTDWYELKLQVVDK